MRNLLALVGAVALTFVAVGWYLGWYQIHTAATSSGHNEVEIDFNTPKIKADLNKGKQKVQQMLDNTNPSSGQQPQTDSTSEEPAEPPAAQHGHGKAPKQQPSGH
jgi:hypothetical protein